MGLFGNDGTTLSAEEVQALIRGANNWSWFVNILLLASKIWAYVVSSSQAVLASLIDSVVDLLTQVVVSLCQYLMAKSSVFYPVGRARLEAIGVLTCAGLMMFGSIEVILSASEVIKGAIETGTTDLTIEANMIIVMASTIVIKFFLWLYCRQVQDKSDIIKALAEDHFNDVITNVGALVAGIVASKVSKAWWLDPATAIFLSLYIIWRWSFQVADQIGKLVGKIAPDDTISEVRDICSKHHESMEVDALRVYHFGSRFNVEVEVVMPLQTTLKDSHDISLALQDKIESLEFVERCFVHVDYARRTALEHKVERELLTLSRV